jgi:hypothetical protein
MFDAATRNGYMWHALMLRGRSSAVAQFQPCDRGAAATEQENGRQREHWAGN